MSKKHRKDCRRASFRRHVAPYGADTREILWLLGGIRAGLDVVPNRGPLRRSIARREAEARDAADAASCGEGET